MEYFGNRIEPFHMKDDRETGTIHEDGFVEISKTKERQTRYLFFPRLMLIFPLIGMHG
jgi:hypothetical protein